MDVYNCIQIHLTLPNLIKSAIEGETPHSTPAQAFDARMGEEEEKRNQKEEQKKETGRPQPIYLDHLVASYDPHGLYGGPILKSPAHRAKK